MNNRKTAFNRRWQVGIFLAILMLSSGCIGAANDSVDVPEEAIVVTATIDLEGTPMTSADYVTAVMTVTEGDGPYIVSWTLDGVLVQSSTSLRYEAGFLTVGVHQLDVSIIDSRGGEGEAAILFSIADANRAPLVDLDLPTNGIAGMPIEWSVTANDADGDDLSIDVDFADGTTGKDWSGSHIWAHPGQYIVEATVTDSHGYVATSREAIHIDRADAPTLAVTTDPSGEGRISMHLIEEMVIETYAEDPLGPVNVRIDYGDGFAIEPADESETYQYSEAGIYTITVTARGPTGVTTQRLIHIEVVGDIDDLEAAELHDEAEEETEEVLQDGLDQLLDQNADGIVDEVEDANNEQAYDYEEDFDPDDDGEMDDEEEINNWQTKDDDTIRDDAGEEADSDEVESDLLDADAQLTDSERTMSEAENTPMPSIQTAYSNIVEPVMSAAWDEVTDESAQESTYSRSVMTVTSTWINSSHWEDWDGDGVAEVLCTTQVASYWYDNDGIPGPEWIYLWHVETCAHDRDGDGVDDQWRYWYRGLIIRDLNSNGIPEVRNSYNYSLSMWTNGSITDRNWQMTTNGMTDLDEDGNLERYIAYDRNARWVTVNGSWYNLILWTSETEMVWWTDWNDDGTKDVEYIIDHRNFRSDPNADGNRDTRRDYLRSITRFDRDRDGSVDLKRSVQQWTNAYDNNSDGVIELHWTYRVASMKDDTDRDGDLEHTVAMRSWSTHWDWGLVEYRIDWSLTVDRVDDDDDGNPETLQRTFERSNGSDFDTDRFLEREDTLNAQVRKWDPDSDGVWEHTFRRVQMGTYLDQHAHGFVYSDTSAWSVERWLNPSTDQLWFIRIAVHNVRAWDNNSDGATDTIRSNVWWWNAADMDGDGFLERRVILFYNHVLIDDDADGNYSWQRISYIYHLRVLDANGTQIQGWYMHYVMFRHNINHLGHAFYTNATYVAWAWDASNGWTHVITTTWQAWDFDRDGVVDSTNYTSAQQSTPP